MRAALTGAEAVKIHLKDPGLAVCVQCVLPTPSSGTADCRSPRPRRRRSPAYEGCGAPVHAEHRASDEPILPEGNRRYS